MQPFLIGKKIEVVPFKRKGTCSDRIQIFLGEGKSFGSGEHETTRTCLEILETLQTLQNSLVLDIGTGTGILAIAALKLGAKTVTAIDNNPKAVRNAQNNARINNLENRLKIVQGELVCIGNVQFDVIMANIYDDILLSQSENIVSMTSRNGFILLSGICLHESYEIKKRYKGLLKNEVLKSKMGEEYVTFLFQKVYSYP